MARKLPKLLQNFALYVNGIGLASSNTDVKLPTLDMRLKEHQGGGMFTPVEIPIGTEKLELGFNMVEYDADVIGLFGQGDTQLTFRGFARNNMNEEQTVVIYATGMIKQMAPGNHQPGNADSVIEYMVALTHYALEIDGAEIANVDVVNGKAIFNGVDLAGGMADALGLS